MNIVALGVGFYRIACSSKPRVGRASGDGVQPGPAAFRSEKGSFLPHGDYRNPCEYRDPLRKLNPHVVLDMTPLTEQDALNVVAGFGGFAGRVVSLTAARTCIAHGAYPRG
jgi:hypothetical protein